MLCLPLASPTLGVAKSEPMLSHEASWHAHPTKCYHQEGPGASGTQPSLPALDCLRTGSSWRPMRPPWAATSEWISEQRSPSSDLGQVCLDPRGQHRERSKAEHLDTWHFCPLIWQQPPGPSLGNSLAYISPWGFGQPNTSTRPQSVQ